MSLTQNRWFRHLGLGAIAAVALGTAAMTTAPAQAQDYGYRGPMVVHRAEYVPRFFFGFGGGHRWDRRDYSDHRGYWDHRDYGDQRWR